MKKSKNIKDRILPFFLKNERKTKEKKKDTQEIKQVDDSVTIIKTEDEIEHKQNITDVTVEEVYSDIHKYYEEDSKKNLEQNKKNNESKIDKKVFIEKNNTVNSKQIEKPHDRIVPTIVGLMSTLEKTPSISKNEQKEESTSLLSKDEKIQIAIIEEIKEYIDDDLKEIDELSYKINALKDKEEDEVLLEEAKKIKKELEELIKLIELFRQKYENIYNKIKIQDLKVIDNDILEISIKDYINSAKDGKDTSDFFNKIEEVVIYLDVLNKIIDIDKNKDELEIKVDEKIDLFEERDKDFEETLDSKAKIEDINYDIEKYNDIVKSALEDLERKMSNSTEINSRIETTTRRAINFGRIIAAAVMLAQTPHIPPTPRGILLRTGLVGAAIHLLLNSVYTETTSRRIDTITYIDFNREILNNKEIIAESLKMIGTSYDELQQVKKMFEEEFEEYAKDIPEYAELIKNIMELEKELQRQEEKTNEYSNELDEKLKLNNEKIKTIEEYVS